jgi:hypothetical protein
MMDTLPTRVGMVKFSRQADYVCQLILSSDSADVDIAIARSRLRDQCESLYPDRLDLFDQIYESRFDRLWDQFREPEQEDREADWGLLDDSLF